MEAALRELAEVERALAEVEGERAERVGRLDAEVERERGPLEGRRAGLASAVERFCRKQKPALDRVDGHERKSRRLESGRVGWRASQAVVIRDEAAAMKALAGWRPGREFLRVRTEIDREGLRGFLARVQALNGNGVGMRRRLSRAGIRMERREKWFYEIDWEAVRKWKR